ncbi:MAG: hypothetical protein KTR27_08265 [Leptolyngbyaceae cyanobacterium MAG.088]|nr:hypothetical protein [Leptolyngbyaceae cyanobacterium MAG.088]
MPSGAKHTFKILTCLVGQTLNPATDHAMGILPNLNCTIAIPKTLNILKCEADVWKSD